MFFRAAENGAAQTTEQQAQKTGDVGKTAPVSASRPTPQVSKNLRRFFISIHRKERKAMPVFRVEKNKGYTVMSNHHLRNKDLSLKAKGLLSQMLSLPENWDYTLKGLALINREKIDAIRQAIRELERAGYIVRSRERDERGRLRGADYVIYEQPQEPPASDLPTLENPTQLNKDRVTKDQASLLRGTPLNWRRGFKRK